MGANISVPSRPSRSSASVPDINKINGHQVEDGQAGDHHPVVASWFLGPRAENFKYMAQSFLQILHDQKEARHSLFPNDPAFITPEIQSDERFQASIEYLNNRLHLLSEKLSTNCIPFWSPRFNGHMNMDTTMPALLGYLTAMLYNPNNLAIEGSPLTTMLEIVVGKQLSEMLGYNVVPSPDPSVPVGWGHITADGSIANLEAIWVARNLKFYPLSLFLAVTEGPLKFIKSNPRPLIVPLCDGNKKPFVDLTTWELLNLTPDAAMSLSHQISELYGISQTALTKAITPYLIQDTGRRWLEKKFGIENEAVMFISSTAHYSWPKGCAITGIGAANIISVDVDLNARMSISNLRSKLSDALANERAVYSVVAIIGSTEHGAVDPLKEILEVRKEFQKQGLSFLIHCDGAWGGYFASMVDVKTKGGNGISNSTRNHTMGFVPRQTLNTYTVEQLVSFGEADSVTIDPHKYALLLLNMNPFLLYGLTRSLNLSLVIDLDYVPTQLVGSVIAMSIGVYGVEGSKPGAAAAGVWLSHEVIGLNKNGYGTLLGEGVFTCAKLHANWATLSTDDDNFIVTPFNRLPAEVDGKSSEEIEKQKEFIRKYIINVDNKTLAKDQAAWELLKLLGGDLMANAMACNFKYTIGDKKVLNTSIVEANIMNTRIFNRVSVARPGEEVKKRELFLTSSQFSQENYGECLTNYKKRLGLEGPDDLCSLLNVTMSPWPTDGNFLTDVVVAEFKKIVQEEAQYAIARNTTSPDFHGFVMQGDSPLHLVHLPMFNMKNHRYQLIITGDLPADIFEIYKSDKAANPDAVYLLGNKNADILEELVGATEFEAVIDKGFPPDDGSHWLSGFKLTNIKLVLNQSLELDDLKKTFPHTDNRLYPSRMPFWMYGTKEQTHIDHILTWSPNAQLNSECVKCDFERELTEEELSDIVVCTFDGLDENFMQPIANDPGQENPNTNWHTPALPFHRSSTFSVIIYSNYHDSQSGAAPLTKGTITLGGCYADWDIINEIPGSPGQHEMDLLLKDYDILSDTPNSFGTHPIRRRSLKPNLTENHPIHNTYKELLDRKRIEIAKEWTLGFEPFERFKSVIAGSLEKKSMKADIKKLPKRRNITLEDF
ncbi:hypothetical protein TWF106_001771 [Orbilia oligospora]|uniref:PLP-dependent transferase n=1 Tax=Orbilia oligospora TaxID=2813651 RepID=A0A6G1MKK6_ORBOL|nr:hypothetical protein TWF788_007014 [Orbilia oligospora]KAF3217971.1 hypothetical protein TWF679_001385 [Orbilia oligospora]KAF3225898.1 hypothetical protein TWF106_001771 [Orbilia oligospora]KAF3226135.1 hypothetical protein TWF191_004797 [Orbilia oligospora]KAF3262330.1 hypothetical protein TWF192_007004 [Orbilia oligospora]